VELPSHREGGERSIYVNGPGTGNVTSLTSQVTDSAPNLPTSPAWTINGRFFGSGGLLDELRLSNTALNPAQFLVSRPTVPFLVFSAKLAIQFRSTPNIDAFQLNSSFTLSSRASNGINPVTERVTLNIGTFTVTLPPGSFKNDPAGFAFNGVGGGVSLAVLIKPAGTLRYSFQAEATAQIR
jgi:hypothetical protein